MKKYIVVHSGARDLYKVAKALYEKDCLAYLVTDDILLRKKYRRLFPLSKVKISIRGLICRLLYVLFPNVQTFYTYGDRYLGNYAGKLSKKKGFPLLAYSEYAFHAFRQTEIRPKILFQFHPHAVSNKKIFENEIIKNPIVKKNLLLEKEMRISSEHLNELAQEVKMADYIIAASSFTKETLVENGALPQRVAVAPYGVNLKDYPFFTRPPKKVITFAYVGNYTFRKGIHYLLKGAKMLQEQGYIFNIEMTGRTKYDPQLINSYDVHNLIVHQGLNHEEMLNMLKRSDVFLFPSLCEGFAFSLIEAMATGLPVISTNHTAASDIVDNNVEGFVINPSDEFAVADAMKFFIDNPDKCLSMGKSARERVSSISWGNFEKNIINSIEVAESVIVNT